MRSLLQRISIHNALLSWYWSDSQLKKVLGDSLTSYMEAAPMGIISLLKKDHPKPSFSALFVLACKGELDVAGAAG